jgi:uncharacterized phage-associated protein
MAYITNNDVRVIANRFIELGMQDGTPVDPMKLQKLAYLADGWNLVFYGMPLFIQPVEAWRYGPVVSDLYHQFKGFRAAPIDRTAPVLGHLTPDVTNLVDSVWHTYKEYSAIQLSMLTHEPGGAWDLTTRNIAGFWGSRIIPNELIKEEFKQRQQRG